VSVLRTWGVTLTSVREYIQGNLTSVCAQPTLKLEKLFHPEKVKSKLISAKSFLVGCQKFIFLKASNEQRLNQSLAQRLFMQLVELACHAIAFFVMKNRQYRNWLRVPIQHCCCIHSRENPLAALR
jgi:hypothetical protein